MAEMKIYVENLKAYNEGYSRGEWFNLPVDIKEVYYTIFNEDELDEHGLPKYDWAIHDYELPFEISEYESIELLNNMAEELEDIYSFDAILAGNYDIQDAINFAREMENEVAVENIVDDRYITDRIAYKIAEGNSWASIKHMIQHADSKDDYHLIDGYNNFEKMPVGYEKTVVSEVLNEFKKNHSSYIQKVRDMKKNRKNNAYER